MLGFFGRLGAAAAVCDCQSKATAAAAAAGPGGRRVPAVGPGAGAAVRVAGCPLAGCESAIATPGPRAGQPGSGPRLLCQCDAGRAA